MTATATGTGHTLLPGTAEAGLLWLAGSQRSVASTRDELRTAIEGGTDLGHARNTCRWRRRRRDLPTVS